jgi:hypothetical protein
MRVQDMPWDNPEFVAAAEMIFRAGVRAGEDNATAYEWGSIGRGQTWADFVKHAQAGYED